MMETTIQLNLPDDFSTLCTLYQIPPEHLIQTFVDHVSFPGYYSQPMSDFRWATLFFLNYLDMENSKYEVDEELEDQYLDSFYYAMQEPFVPNTGCEKRVEIAGRQVMNQWLKTVLQKRARYITDSL